MVIMWPNEHGITLSQRQASGHIAPAVVSGPPRVAKLLNSSYSTDTGSSMRFSVPSSDKTEEKLIWAFSKTQPKGGADAELSQHLWSGYGTINYHKDYEEVSNPMPVNSKTAERNGMPSSVLVAHIAIGVMVTMLLLPGGVVVPRIVRGLTTSKVWFPLHIAVQGGLCLLFLLITLGTGASFGNTSSTHRGCGIALFVFFLVQCLLGIVAHWVKLPDRLKRFSFTTKRGRGPSNLLHFGIGLLVVALGWATCWTGFVSQWPATGHGYSAPSLKAGWGVMLAFWLIVYALALWFFLPRQLRIEAEERAMEEHDQQKFFSPSVAPVTPRPPEPKAQRGFSPPPSPSMIPISSQWFRQSQESPKHSSLDRAERKRHSELHTSGMPTSGVVPRVSSRERLDSVITYEGSLSRQQSEESMQSRFAQSRRSSRGSRGSLGSMEESLATGLNSLKNSVTSLKSLRSRRGSDAPPTAFPFRRGSDSQLYTAQVAVSDPFKSPVTPTFRPIVSPAPSAYRRDRRDSDDGLSFRARRRRRDSNASAHSSSSFEYRERKTSDASFLAIERPEPEEPPLKLVDKRDSDPFGLNKALGALSLGNFSSNLSFSSENLSLFREKKETVVNAITGVRERKPSHGRRWSDQSARSNRSGRSSLSKATSAPRSRSGSIAEPAPSSFAPRSRNNSFGDVPRRGSVDGRRSLDAAPSAYTGTRSRSGSLAQAQRKESHSRKNSTTTPPVSGTPKTTPARPLSRGSSTPPVAQKRSAPRTAPHARPAPKPPVAQAVVNIPASPVPKFEPRPTPSVPSPAVSRPNSSSAPNSAPSAPTSAPPVASSAPSIPLTISSTPRHPFTSPPPPQRSSDLRLRRLSNSHRAIPKLEVRTGRTPATPPSSSATVTASPGAVPIGAHVEGRQDGRGRVAPLTSATKRSHISSVTPIASRFRANTVASTRSEMSTVSAVSDESVPPPVPPKDY